MKRCFCLALAVLLFAAQPCRSSAEEPEQASQAPDPIVISKGDAALRYQAFPDACRLKNGDIVAVFYAGYGHVSLPNDEVPKGGRICMVRSSDEGRTWSEPTVVYDDGDDNRDPHIAQLDDGALLCTFFSLVAPEPDSAEAKAGKAWRGAGVKIVASRDNGDTWDEQARSPFPGWYCSAPVRQLPDGVCILGLYRADAETGFSVAGTSRSKDRGLTWETPVEMRLAGVSLDAETDVIRLNDGTLYAALRSGTNQMYYATSDDDAKSWSEVREAGFEAHCPHFTRLSDGEIVLSHRLPNTSIHVSRDEAKTWAGPYEIDSCIGAYPATVELKDGSVLIVYYTEGEGSEIRAQRFQLRADGIDFLPLGIAFTTPVK